MTKELTMAQWEVLDFLLTIGNVPLAALHNQIVKSLVAKSYASITTDNKVSITELGREEFNKTVKRKRQ